MNSTTPDSNMTENEEYQILLMQYAAGCLDQAQSMIITAHLGMSDKGHQILKDCACIGGTLLEKKCEPVSMSAKSLENIMSQIDCCPELECDSEEKCGAALPEGHYLPECVQKNIKAKNPAQTLKWKTFYPGISFIGLPLECTQSKAHLVKIKPGHTTPSHRHSGLTITLLLNGGIYDNGAQYGIGDLIIHDVQSAPYNPKSCTTNGCISLTVHASPIKLTGIASILNPLIRF